MICTEDAEINFVDGHFDIHTLPRSHVHVGKIIEDDRQKVIVNKSQNDKNQHRRSNHDMAARNELSGNIENVEIIDPPMKSSNNEMRRFDDTRENDMKPKGMMKSHYVDKNQKKACTGCQKMFKLKRKPKHCRRCGGVFCLQCVKYKRKLNILANPDPEGKLRKVCRTCFEEGLLMIGQTRSLIDDFIQQRSFAKYGRIINSRVNSLTTTFWPDQIDIQTECLRLLRGFQEEIRQLGSANALQALKVKLKTPAWQKSNYWNIEIQSRVCRACKGDIGIRKSTGNCRVCGLALCRKCSHRELLLYFENVEISEDAKLAIINTPGAPLQEPNISLLLYVCLSCKERISEKQKLDIYWFRHQTLETNICQDIVNVDVTIKALKKKISLTVVKLEEILDYSEHNELTSTEKGKTSLEITTLRSELTALEKELKPVRFWFNDTLTKSQTTLLTNFIKGNHDFYLDSRYKCRALSNKLETKCNKVKQDDHETMRIAS